MSYTDKNKPILYFSHDTDNWKEAHICDLKEGNTFKLDQSGYEYTVDLIKHNLVRYREVHTLRKTAHSRYLPYISTQKVFIKQ